MESVAGYFGYEKQGFCGAKLTKRAGTLHIELYDEEIGNFLLKFTGVKKIQFSDADLCSPCLALYSCEVVDLGPTEDLQETIKASLKRSATPPHLKHYSIFLPEIGVYEIFAEEVEDVSAETYSEGV